MTQQEQFEADYLAAFGCGSFETFFDMPAVYKARDTQMAWRIWLQQAKRHEAESSAKVGAQAVPASMRALLDRIEYDVSQGRHTTHQLFTEMRQLVNSASAASPAQAVSEQKEFIEPEDGWTFTSYRQALEFLSGRMKFAGVSDSVARVYANEIDHLLSQAVSLTTPTPSVSCVPEGCYHLTLDKFEVGALADYHDYQQENAYSCGMECEGDKIRSAELRAMLAAAPNPTGLGNPKEPKS